MSDHPVVIRALELEMIQENLNYAERVSEQLCIPLDHVKHMAKHGVVIGDMVEVYTCVDPFERGILSITKLILKRDRTAFAEWTMDDAFEWLLRTMGR